MAGDHAAGCPWYEYPLIFIDLNDGIGIQRISGSWIECDTCCMSVASKRRERIPGGAGELVRAICETFSLGSISSWDDSRNIFFGNALNSDSLIDHLFVPLNLIPGKRSAGPLMHMGKIQVIVRNEPADHVPVHAVIFTSLSTPCAPCDSPQPSLVNDINISEIMWRSDSLMRGLREGEHREEFINNLELAVGNLLASSETFIGNCRTPGQYFQALDSTVIKEALVFFGKNLSKRMRILPG